MRKKGKAAEERKRRGCVSQEKFNKTISNGGGVPERVLERHFC